MLDLVKQLKVVSFDTAFHDDSKCFIAWGNNDLWKRSVVLHCFDTKPNNFLSVMGFEASYYNWLRNRRCIWRQESQVDIRDVLDFRVSRAIFNQKGNLSILSSKG